MKTNGPGKYDEACTVAREMTDAVGCLLIVVGGKEGMGFSMQSLEPDLILHIPAILRLVAEDIEMQNRKNADA